MNSTPRIVFRQAKERLRKAGFQIKGWSLNKGFKPDTVFKFFQGKLGARKGGPVSQAIIEALKKEGCWPENDESRRAA